jgi:hypothetical protein
VAAAALALLLLLLLGVAHFDVCWPCLSVGKGIVFRFIIEYSSLRDFEPEVVGLFLYEDF